jgi:hypothetical protein
MSVISCRNYRGAAFFSIIEVVVVISEPNRKYGGHYIRDYVDQLQIEVPDIQCVISVLGIIKKVGRDAHG